MLKEKYAQEIDALLARYPDKRSAVLQLMHMAQEEYGYMSKEAMKDVAGVLDLDPTHVLSLTGFYSLFYEQPVGKYVLEICTDLACALRGAPVFFGGRAIRRIWRTPRPGQALAVADQHRAPTNDDAILKSEDTHPLQSRILR